MFSYNFKYRDAKKQYENKEEEEFNEYRRREYTVDVDRSKRQGHR